MKVKNDHFEVLIFFRLLLSNCLNWKFTVMIILHLLHGMSAKIRRKIRGTDQHSTADALTTHDPRICTFSLKTYRYRYLNMQGRSSV